MASRLKQSNLTSLSSTQKKTQEKSLEEQVYEMAIENIEAERLKKTFVRMCEDRSNEKSQVKEESQRHPYAISHM